MNMTGVVRWFVDENLRGPGKMLAQSDPSFAVARPGSPLGIVPGMTDEQWMSALRGHDVVVITQDKHVRTRPRERDLICEHGLRVVIFSARQALRMADQVELIRHHLPRIERERVRLGNGPWVLRMTKAHVKELGIDCEERIRH